MLSVYLACRFCASFSIENLAWDLSGIIGDPALCSLTLKRNVNVVQHSILMLSSVVNVMLHNYSVVFACCCSVGFSGSGDFAFLQLIWI